VSGARSAGPGRPASALLLDLDGTLVDSEPIHRDAYRSFFTARGWEYDEELLGRFTGRRADDVFARTPGPWHGEDPTALHAEVVGHLDTDRLPEAVPGAAALVAAAVAAGVPMAVVTSAGPDWVAATLDPVLGMHDHVAEVVTREDVVDGKPDPTGYAMACERLGADPAAAVAVEDSPAGLRAALAAGVGRVVGVTTTWSAEELGAAGATHVVDDLRDVVPLLTPA
jgi:sugar-phosphatase